jgi:hypothetical protein
MWICLECSLLRASVMCVFQCTQKLTHRETKLFLLVWKSDLIVSQGTAPTRKKPSYPFLKGCHMLAKFWYFAIDIVFHVVVYWSIFERINNCIYMYMYMYIYIYIYAILRPLSVSAVIMSANMYTCDSRWCSDHSLLPLSVYDAGVKSISDRNTDHGAHFRDDLSCMYNHMLVYNQEMQRRHPR